MSEQGPRALDGDRFPVSKPVVDPFDPVALAARLSEARAQRAIALAKREQRETSQPDSKPAVATVASFGSAARRSVAALPTASLPTREPPVPAVLRASPEMRAVPTRTSDRSRRAGETFAVSQEPASGSRRSIVRRRPLAAFFVGCVTVGTGVLVLQPSILPQRTSDVSEPLLDAPPAFAPLNIAAPAVSPDPVPPFSPNPAEDPRLSSAEFVAASGSIGPNAAPAPSSPVPPIGAEPDRMVAPDRPPEVVHAPAPVVASLAGQWPQTVEGRITDRANDVPIAGMPVVRSPSPPTVSASLAPSEAGSGSPEASAAEDGEFAGDSPESGIPSAWAAARVSIFYPTGSGGTAVEALERIAGMGGSQPAATPVAHNIGRTNVRYYHETDLPAAREAAAALEAEARDFTDFRPRPDPGTIEVWLAGEVSAPAPAPVAASVQRPQRAAAPDRPTPAPEPDQRVRVSGVEQQRLELQVQRLLREQLRELRRR